MNYTHMEEEFIVRTKHILEQYNTYIPSNQNKFEVTLLMNCFMGLLIYPQQVAHINNNRKWGNWLTQELVLDVASDWYLEPDKDIIKAGYVRVNKEDHPNLEMPITIEKLKMRNLVRQMRNTAAHAAFSADGDATKPNQLRIVTFRDTSRSDGFHIELPVNRLKMFVIKLADSALERLQSS